MINNLFENLPDITFAEKDPAVIQAEIIERFERELGRRIYPGDPWMQVMLTLAYTFAVLRANIDFAGKQNLLRFASDGFLQELGRLLGVEQLQENHATTMLEFTLSTTLATVAHIPQGTRASPGGNISFATLEDLEIPPGELSGVVPARCMTAGTIGNGFEPGTINTLTDPFPFNSAVSNTEVSKGGSDIEDIEALRGRIHLAPESFSVAGPYGAYRFWARSANQLISDVSVHSPAPGIVEIVPLLSGGAVPTQSILDEVYRECSDRTRRPLTDKVIVRAPESVGFDIAFTYYINRSDAPNAAQIRHRVADAVDEYIMWQKSVLGRDINPSQLTKMVMKSGVKRIEIEAPVRTVLEHYKIGVADDTSGIVFGGIEDD
ncbi:MAG: baseplate J/gp47 family protein [Oscillospiraceae bacterium]|nr:baseplate J/gp47 family protein [Oscillospiraceae bacterium]